MRRPRRAVRSCTQVPADTASAADIASFGKIATLAHRLFPAARKPFRLDRDPGALPVDCREDASLPADGYRLDFAPERIALVSARFMARRKATRF